MTASSHIEWTDMTWNPVTGCTKVSQGCKHCYAAAMALRLQRMGQPRYRNGFEVTLHPDALQLPRKWTGSRLVFVNSMSDVFHPDVPEEFIAEMFRVMNECPQHTFQLLTKRSERARELASRFEWTDNIWMGVSVEDERVTHRIDDLRSIPAHVRFLSVEPLIGPLTCLNLSGIQWVIVGGESGPGARTMESEWVESILKQCREQDSAFFFKQWGGVRKKAAGRLLHGVTYDEMPISRPRGDGAKMLEARAAYALKE